MPLPSRNTSSGRLVVVDTALLACSFLPSSAKETRSGCLCPDGCAPRGTSRQRNTHNIELREVRYPWHPWHARGGPRRSDQEWASCVSVRRRGEPVSRRRTDTQLAHSWSELRGPPRACQGC